MNANGDEKTCSLGPGPRGVISLKIPTTHQKENIVICDNSSKEVALWSPNGTTPGPGFVGRFCSNGQGVNVQFEIPEEAAHPPCKCRSGACSGSLIECNATYSRKVPGGCQGLHAWALNILAAVVLAWLLM